MSGSTAQSMLHEQSLGAEQERIVFLHIPKTAGSSVHSVLSQHFDKDETCPERFDGIAALSIEQLSQFKFFSGHYSRGSVERIPGKPKVFTFLRSPEKRILSLYYFWRSHRAEVVEAGNLAGPRIARELELAEFLESKNASILHGVDNAITRQLLDKNYCSRFEQCRSESPQELVDNAVDYLKSMEFVGFQESFTKDFNNLITCLDLPVQESVPAVNTRATNSSESRFEEVVEQPITDRVREGLKKLTVLDRQVYALAKDLFS